MNQQQSSATLTSLIEPNNLDVMIIGSTSGGVISGSFPTDAGTALLLLLMATLNDFSMDRAKVRTQNKSYSYWEADLVGRVVVVGEGLTLPEASARVARGNSIMCRNQSAARTLLFVNGYWGSVGPEISRADGSFWHYHPHRNTNPRIHIWFYGTPE